VTFGQIAPDAARAMRVPARIVRMAAETGSRPRVGLFVTCLVDLIRPRVGFASVKLLEDAGCDVEVPTQTCCGQPAYNSGDRENSRALAIQFIEAFEKYDYIVAPSGSCAGMVRLHYPELFAGEPDWMRRADKLCARTYELVSFLVDVMKMDRVDVLYDGTVTYHDACSGLRELGVRAQPRKLLNSIAGLHIAEMKDADVCCGFGGTFCVKYPDISNTIVEKKAGNIAATGALVLLAGDLGCLMNMAGKLQRMGKPIAARHVAEMLAGMANEPAIGEKPKGPGQ
jgi:L-lactate dehydrogenase complex protein LldE